MTEYYCSICKNRIKKKVAEYSISNFKKYLCIDCQEESRSKNATYYAKKIYKHLKNNKELEEFEIILEYFDGYKKTDISIKKEKRTVLYLEIDGKQHLLDPNKLWKDIKRDEYSYRDGIKTIRIPNELVKKHSKQLAENIAMVVALINLKSEGKSQNKQKEEEIPSFLKEDYKDNTEIETHPDHPDDFDEDLTFDEILGEPDDWRGAVMNAEAREKSYEIEADLAFSWAKKEGIELEEADDEYLDYI